MGWVGFVFVKGEVVGIFILGFVVYLGGDGVFGLGVVGCVG